MNVALVNETLTLQIILAAGSLCRCFFDPLFSSTATSRPLLWGPMKEKIAQRMKKKSETAPASHNYSTISEVYGEINSTSKKHIRTILYVLDGTETSWEWKYSYWNEISWVHLCAWNLTIWVDIK